ncbi:MAG TPA: DUF2232 domain-containing protein [Candidatus Olsenella pullicola]|nr:DUF2232 domain-containing protein [Candidatus Olsenella pullicola]
MSDCPTNGLPPSPRGFGEKDGAARNNRGIVPAGSARAGRPRLSLPAGLFLCALGGVVASSTFAFIGPVLVGYGYVSAATRGGVRGRLAGAAAAVAAAVALSLSRGISSVVAAVVSSLVAVAVAEALLRGRLTPGAGCIVVALAAGCTIAADALLAASQGTTLTASVDELVTLVSEELSETSVAVSALMQQVRAVVSLLWPTAYLVSAFGSYLFATIGAGMAAERAAEKDLTVPKLVSYDLPVWVVAALVAAAAGVAFGLTFEGAAARASLMVSANLVMGLRFAFAAQGFAVLAWSLDQRGTSVLTKFLLGALALYLEVQFVVMSLVGLADIWANFRHLTRGEVAGEQGNARQD